MGFKMVDIVRVKKSEPQFAELIMKSRILKKNWQNALSFCVVGMECVKVVQAK